MSMFTHAIKTMKVILLCIFLVACQTRSIDTKNREFTDYIALNHYDDPWENKWVSHLKRIYQKTTLSCGNIEKTPGFIIHIGDSMTYSSRYGAVSEHGVAKLNSTVYWSQSLQGDTAAADNKNGWQLARFDHPSGGRSYTAVSGITAHQYLHGGKNDFASGWCDQQPLLTLLNNRSATPPSSCPDRSDPPKVAVIHDSIIAIILLGSNDISQGVPPVDIYQDLKAIVQHLEESHIMPVLSTIPPRDGFEFEVIETNQKIIRLAQERGLPMIGFWEEIIKRQPDLNWYGTLISTDGVHPTAGTYRDPSLDPSILNESGYALRGYLTLLKLAEIRSKVINSMASCQDFYP